MATSASRFLLPFASSSNPHPSALLPLPQPFSPRLPSTPRPLSVRPRYRSPPADHHPPSHGGPGRFELAVSLFNDGDYHGSHDVLEEIWNGAEDPARTLAHGVLQCAVGLHHLFNQNHRGAMMELGEGLCKLRKMGFEGGPFLEFEKEISVVLEFLYQTQKELAACTNDLCLAMDGSERSYQLLGSFAAGQRLYRIEPGTDGVSYICFCPDGSYSLHKSIRVKLPKLSSATAEHFETRDYPQN